MLTSKSSATQDHALDFKGSTKDVETVKTHYRLARWESDRKQLKFLSDALSQKVLPRLAQALQSPQDLARQQAAFVELNQFGLGIYKLSRRNEQLLLRHPELDWRTLSCVADFFRDCHDQQTLLSQTQLQAIHDEFSILQSEFKTLDKDCQKQIKRLTKNAASFQALDAMQNAFQVSCVTIIEMLIALDKIDYNMTAEDFKLNHGQTFIDFHARLKDAVDILDQHVKQQDLIKYNYKRLKNLLKEIGNQDKFNHNRWVRNLVSGYKVCQEALKLDTKPEKGLSRQEQVSSKFPQLSALVVSHRTTFLQNYMATEVEHWSRAGLEDGLTHRAAMLRLLTSAGELSKDFKQTTSGQDDYFLAIAGLRDLLVHYFDYDQGRSALYYLLTTDNLVCDNMVSRMQTVLNQFADMLAGKPIAADAIQEVTLLQEALTTMHDDESLPTLSPLGACDALLPFIRLGDQLLDSSPASRIAAEFIIMAVGETAKPLQHDKLFRRLAEREASLSHKINCYDFLTQIVSFRNDLSHEFLLAKSYQCEVQQDLQLLLKYADTFQRLASQMATELTIEKHYHKRFEMRQSCGELAENIQRNANIIKGDDNTRRTALVGELKIKINSHIKAMIAVVVSEFPGVPIGHVTSQFLRVFQECVSQKKSPSKFKLPQGLTHEIREICKRPQTVLRDIYHEKWEMIQAEWKSISAELEHATNKWDQDSTPIKRGKMYKLRQCIKAMMEQDHQDVRGVGNFLDMIENVTGQLYDQSPVKKSLRSIIDQCIQENRPNLEEVSANLLWQVPEREVVSKNLFERFAEFDGEDISDDEVLAQTLESF